ncbi:MAG: discoidin domain-containing protein [Bacteroidia bacterium]|nr:discoidin domain-containing protein [Bacteroidia bacterium]
MTGTKVSLISGLLSLFLIPIFSFGQCDTSLIPHQDYKLIFVDSETAGQPAINAIDGDSNSYFRTNGNDPFPHEIQLDLGMSYKVNQIGIRPRIDLPNGKIAQYEIYVSQDSLNWGSAQASGSLSYEEYQDLREKIMSFGAVEGRFVKLVALSNEDPSNRHRWLASEIYIYQDSCASNLKQNQILDFPQLEIQKTIDSSLTLVASSSSGLGVEFEVVSGPGLVQGNKLTFTGAGIIQVKARQAGDGTYYPVESLQEIEVLAAEDFPPTIITPLHGNFPIEMDVLKAYPLYARAELDYPELFELDSIAFVIEGQTYPATKEGDLFQVNWRPAAYGFYEIQLTAVSKDGVSKTETYNVDVFPSSGRRFYSVFKGDVIEFGSTNSRWLYKTVELPQTLGIIDSLHAYFWTKCPDTLPNGCDNWDRLAWIEAQKPNGEWVEIIRYITPYGKGCDHEIDLTDYLGILHGKVNFRMFIDTWGTGGWDVNLDLEYVEGQPDHDYSQLDVLWKGNFPFGNPSNLQPMDTIDFTFRPDGQKSLLHLVTTGHGWGENNSLNAAEFHHAYHDIMIDGVYTFKQDLWADCNPNPDACDDQFGTWWFDRAGWCPGAIANRYIYDLTSYKSRSSIAMAYLFDSTYVDECHPNNPNCISGITCTNCNAGYNPQYQVSANVITYFDSLPETKALITANEELEVVEGLNFQLIPNPGQDHFKVQTEKLHGKVSLEVLNVEGKVIFHKNFSNSRKLNNLRFDILDWQPGVYLVRLSHNKGISTQKLMKI